MRAQQVAGARALAKATKREAVAQREADHLRAEQRVEAHRLSVLVRSHHAVARARRTL